MAALRIIAAVMIASAMMMGGALASAQPIPEGGCLTNDDIRAAQDAWAGAVKAIGEAWRSDLEGGLEECTAAEVAQGAIDAAYAYHLDVPVLFKPTYTQDPHTFRNDAAGALSYFVGDCAGALEAEVLSEFDYGFTLGCVRACVRVTQMMAITGGD